MEREKKIGKKQEKKKKINYSYSMGCIKDIYVKMLLLISLCKICFYQLNCNFLSIFFFLTKAEREGIRVEYGIFQI